MSEAEKPSIDELLKQLILSQEQGFAKVNANISIVSYDLDIVKLQVNAGEKRLASMETWRNTASDRVRGLATEVSANDLSHESALADEINARQNLAKKVDGLDVKVDSLDEKQNTQLAILARLELLSKNPIVKHIATAVGAAILTYLGSKGLH